MIETESKSVRVMVLVMVVGLSVFVRIQNKTTFVGCVVCKLPLSKIHCTLDDTDVLLSKMVFLLLLPPRVPVSAVLPVDADIPVQRLGHHNLFWCCRGTSNDD